MSILAFQPQHLKSIPQGVHVIRHPAGTLPDRDAIVAALPRTEQARRSCITTRCGSAAATAMSTTKEHRPS
ncbi:hypothetical protein [Xanthomonas euvesicatoria]|uniref:hypothetical protein n=1 Tax=Xanthomonas euvesicatoria TaxID=456327 RepID=UPI001C460F05|nr:hypothetical protein [Xanthomonas euvesicatoria]MBV6864419.1 hypothetical protein [Xanthomonas campestris pv. coriandri]MCE4327379.1 hypothetical protein [Xanthomonas campestris pv. coriandri]